MTPPRSPYHRLGFWLALTASFAAALLAFHLLLPPPRSGPSATGATTWAPAVSASTTPTVSTVRMQSAAPSTTGAGSSSDSNPPTRQLSSVAARRCAGHQTAATGPFAHPASWSAHLGRLTILLGRRYTMLSVDGTAGVGTTRSTTVAGSFTSVGTDCALGLEDSHQLTTWLFVFDAHADAIDAYLPGRSEPAMTYCGRSASLGWCGA